MVQEPIRERLRDRIRSIERRELLGLVLVGALILGGAVLWYVRSLPSPVRIDAGSPLAGPVAPTALPSPSPSPSVSSEPIVVYVSGLVRYPGVYQFRLGDRVVDAIRRAGGARDRADLTSLNLAALLSDGEQIIVAAKGTVPGLGGSFVTGGVDGGGMDPGGLVNLNTATLDELETLPGIGPALGQRIIDYREQNGPFQSVDDLLNVSGIGEKRLADLRSMVTV
jgi:competence protein ComEA